MYKPCPATATALYLNGPARCTWRIRTADGGVFEVRFASASPVIVRRAAGVNPDRRPRRLAALEAAIGEPLRYTVEGLRGASAAVVVSITRVGPFCPKCGERLLFAICPRCLVDPTHWYAETKFAGKRQSWRRRLVYRLEPVLRLLDRAPIVRVDGAEGARESVGP